jgi:voltage-gated potassium channel
MMYARLRKQTYELLDAGRGEDWVSVSIDWALMVLIILNCVAVILESMPEIGPEWDAAFFRFEVFSVAVFSVEYLARLWSSVDHDDPRFRTPVIGRLKYMLTPMAVIDLLAILPFFLAAFFTLDLRFLRALRLLRLFKLTRYSSSIKLVLDVLKEEVQPICAALFVLMMLIIVAASIAYLFEHQAQPEAFGSIPRAMWWAVVTMTTIGYGDVYPVTLAGKIAGAIIGVISVGMVALPAGLLASGFNDAVHLRRKNYEHLVDHLLADHVIDEDDEALLEEARQRVGLSRKEARAIIRQRQRLIADERPILPNCPHCGAAITPEDVRPKGQLDDLIKQIDESM